jgi:hypothetical protein
MKPGVGDSRWDSTAKYAKGGGAKRRGTGRREKMKMKMKKNQKALRRNPSQG